jgi:hypothetical protein
VDWVIAAASWFLLSIFVGALVGAAIEQVDDHP